MSTTWTGDGIAESLEQILAPLSPSDILQFKPLLSVLRQLFRRGTKLQCWELLPEEYQPLSEPAQASPRLPSQCEPQPLLLSAPPDQLRKLPSRALIRRHSQPGQSKAHRHFVLLKLPDTKVTLLTKIVDSFVSAERLSEQEYLQAWVDNDAPTSDAFARTKEVARSLCVPNTGYIGRLRLLFFAHGVDRIESTVECAHGQRKKSAAFQAISEKCEMEPKKVKEMYDRRRNYLTLVEEVGLGSLLGIGQTCMSDIESLSIEDIERISKHLKKCEPSVTERFKSLNSVAAKVVIEGLKHYGWTLHELAQGGSDITTLIGNYVDLGALSHGEIRELERIGETRTKRRKRPTRESVRKSTTSSANHEVQNISNPYPLDGPTTDGRSSVREIERHSDTIPPSIKRQTVSSTDTPGKRQCRSHNPTMGSHQSPRLTGTRLDPPALIETTMNDIEFSYIGDVMPLLTDEDLVALGHPPR